MSPDERDDELLEEYLKGDSALSRLYREVADEQPGAGLDARIRARAHDNLAPSRRVAHSPFSRNWMIPTSLAAVFVLSVSVLVLMPQPTEVPSLEDGGATDSIPEAAIRRDLPAATAEAEQRSGAGTPAQASKRRKQASDNDDSAGSAGFASGARKAAEEDENAPAQERKEQTRQIQRLSADEAQSPSAAPAALESAGRATADPLPMPATAVRDDPRAWLRFIEALLDERNPDGAKSNLRAFRSRYPDFPLPASLVPLATSLDTEQP
jgi:hypothetical protein